MNKVYIFFACILVAALLIVAVPMVCIWALNIISEQAVWGWYIPHTFATYLATLVLAGVFGRSS